MSYTVFKSGALSAPAAFTAITDSGTLNPGLYDIELTTMQVGTVDTNRRNIRLVRGSTVIADVLSTASPITARLTVDNVSGENFYLLVGETAAGASSVYCAQFSITPR